MNNCGNCGICDLNIDFETETAKRVCTSTGREVDMLDSCKHHTPKGKIVSKELVCNANEGTYFGSDN